MQDHFKSGKTNLSPKPFVKWAGGKRQLIPTISKCLPAKFNTFFEPFLGGGALFFYMLDKYDDPKCNVSDLNSDLILSYVTIRDHIDSLIDSLRNHKEQYDKDSKTYYYSTRDDDPSDPIEKTSRLIFLNRTCFNGLYRVNSKGKFNVPLGSYVNPNIVGEENLRLVSARLQSSKAVIACRDFDDVLKYATRNDFVYFDPPYQPVSDTAHFTSYTKQDFTSDDLDRLADVCNKLDSKGCMILLSNSYSKKVEDMFSDMPWKTSKITANRFINSNSKNRTGHYELLIQNY